MRNSPKKCVSTPDFISQNQLIFEGFVSPFEKKLNPKNLWVVLAKLIPWDEICNIYLKAVAKSTTGRPGFNPRIVLVILNILLKGHLSQEVDGLIQKTQLLKQIFILL